MHTKESWTGAPVTAQAAQLQPLLDKALTVWIALLEQTSETRAASQRH